MWTRLVTAWEAAVWLLEFAGAGVAVLGGYPVGAVAAGGLMPDAGLLRLTGWFA